MSASNLEGIEVFDGGEVLFFSGVEMGRLLEVQKALQDEGVKIKSQVSRIGRRWIFTCEKKGQTASECKVEQNGFLYMLCAPSAESLTAKLEELQQRGGKVTEAPHQTERGWEAIFDEGGQQDVMRVDVSSTRKRS